MIHQFFARQCGHELVYEAIDVEAGQFGLAVRQFFDQGGKGLNITVPFKLEAFELAATCSDRATRAAAVNTLMLDEEGQLFGDNTDGIGLVRDLAENLGWPLKGKRILLLGAGGAVRGVLAPLLAQCPQALCIANRTSQKAVELAELFTGLAETVGCKLTSRSYDALGEQRFDLIINGTSASISGDLPPIPDALLQADTCCYDMMYGAKPTAFLQMAAGHGCAELSDGLGMLVEQAAESYRLWQGIKPKTQRVIAKVREKMEQE